MKHMWLYSILLAATQLIYRRNEYLSVTSQCTLVLPFRHINTHKQGQVWVVVSNKKKNTQIYKNDILITFSTSLEELWGICLRTTLKKRLHLCMFSESKSFTPITFNTGDNCLRELAMCIKIHHPGSTFLKGSKVHPPLLHLHSDAQQILIWNVLPIDF